MNSSVLPFDLYAYTIIPLNKIRRNSWSTYIGQLGLQSFRWNENEEDLVGIINIRKDETFELCEDLKVKDICWVKYDKNLFTQEFYRGKMLKRVFKGEAEHIHNPLPTQHLERYLIMEYGHLEYTHLFQINKLNNKIFKEDHSFEQIIEYRHRIQTLLKHSS
ncbi:hypothetical protein [Spirochaeta cellobiosiphila]|uniref:hypothetical protein n=1 Tax=Spirochaeta cellobiosiphila TaxID=504483 RepID=UPI00040D3AAD|nr:hypothetical protein [Spirochaeta cellobiosiphila]